MFDFTLELIARAASNSLIVFCFCNLIVVLILVGSKPGPNPHKKTQVPLLKVNNLNANRKQELLVAKHSVGGNNMLINFNQGSKFFREAPVAVNENGNGNHNDNDEFRRRVEEFIDKVNRGWKTESSLA
ncbi:hypothetical protein JCGZ_26218 [Jatropha curcas]|uniref:Uncharacterized protein n=1 Tax=Jatropha curcas TaxID=180498 RepID=A0A067JEX7_JATCU|nr:hypothetical protein JCGZ_26218 [Jatropha curcas]